MKHTPGPWTVDASRDRFIIRGKDTYSIAELELQFRTRNFMEQEANAHLIAAAPDLLEACEQLIDTWSDRTVTNDLPEAWKYQHGYRFDTAIGMVNEAIAKAKGK